MYAAYPWLGPGAQLGLDCVGFVHAVFVETGHKAGAAGVTHPVVAGRADVPGMFVYYRDTPPSGVYLDTRLMYKSASMINDDYADPGDIIIFMSATDLQYPWWDRTYTPVRTNLLHVGIYTGENASGQGMVIHMTNAGGGVMETRTRDAWQAANLTYHVAGIVRTGLTGPPEHAVLPTAPEAIASVILDVTGYYTNDQSGAAWFPVAPPRRAFDTRADSHYHVGPLVTLQHAARQTVALWGIGGVPGGATAITGNLTAVNETAPGYVTASPAGSLGSGCPTPTSTLNFPTGDTRANGVTVGLTQGRLDLIYCAVSGARADIILDITGYFTDEMPGATYHPMSEPTRVMPATAIRSQSKITEYITWPKGVTPAIPEQATAVTGNVTIARTGHTLAGYVTVAPGHSLAEGTPPSSSTINFPALDIRANGVTVGLSEDGALDFVYWAGAGATVNVIFDVTGYFTDDSTGMTYHPLTWPQRVLDSRGMIQPNGAMVHYFVSMTKQSWFVKAGILIDAEAITANVTVTQQACQGYLTVTPGGRLTSGVFPNTSTINFREYDPDKNDIRANNVSVGLRPDLTEGGQFDPHAGETDLMYVSASVCLAPQS
jgi:hypothetical protein